MWFRSAKEFAESIELKMLVIIPSYHLIYTYQDEDDVMNQNERGIFVDAWLLDQKSKLRVVKRLDTFQGGRFIFD